MEEHGGLMLRDGLLMLGFALVALFAPALWHKWDVRASIARMTAYKSFAAEFLDSIQGLATLKAFGQGRTRADKLGVEARDLFRRTMWVLGTNSLARGITDTSIAGGAAAALIYGASRVELNYAIPDQAQPGYLRRYDVFGAYFISLHNDVEVPLGCGKFIAGFRAEWNYNWSDILLTRGGDVQDLNLLLNFGYRF